MGGRGLVGAEVVAHQAGMEGGEGCRVRSRSREGVVRERRFSLGGPPFLCTLGGGPIDMRPIGGLLPSVPSFQPSEGSEATKKERKCNQRWTD